MNKILLLFILFILCEIILAFVFAATAQWYYKKMGLDIRSIIKGMTERVFLFITLLNGYPHALTLFSALKLATRLKHNEKLDDAENKFNDYYLVGNLVSVCFAVLYVYLYNNIETIPILKSILAA